MDEDPSYLYQLFLLTPTVSIGFLSFSILLTLFLLFLSAMISGSEVAFFSFSVEEIRECKDSNNEKERKIASLLENPKKLLATILIFNNLVNVAIVTFSTYALWHIFTPSELSGKLIAFASFVITFLIVFFGELIPKVYANNKRKEFALFTYNLLLVANKLFHGLSVLLINITTVVERRMKKEQYAVTVQDLQTAVEIVSTEETTEEEKEILKGIVNFGTISAKQIMCIRTDVTAFDYEINFHELMDKINKCNHSRIPVYRDTIDNIVGILYVKDLLPYIEDDENFNWQTLLRKTYFIPESKKIDALLNSFKERRVHLAIVVDEYGGTSGLVTMEDVLEEIVGEINDEFDDDDINYKKIDSLTYIFEAKTSLNDFYKITDVPSGYFDEIKGESESLGGLILELNTSLPKVSEQIKYEGFIFYIESVNNKRIKRVRVTVDPKSIDTQ